MKSRLAMTLTALLAVAAPAATAETDPDNAIKFRKNVMKAVGGSASAIAAVLKGEVEAPGSLPVLTATLAAASDPTLTIAAFKTDTTDQGFEKTTATPKVWTDWAAFEKGLKDMSAAVETAAAKGGDISLADMSEVFKTCKSCHDDFREK